MKCGHVKRQLTGKQLLDVAVGAWFDKNLLPDSLMVWAVVSRGCMSKEDICKIHNMTPLDLDKQLKAGVLLFF